MDRPACLKCPFKINSVTGYDLDAMAALDAGDAPACHTIVGPHAIFQSAPFEPSDDLACTGYRAWLAELPGFAKPIAVSTGTPGK